MDNEKIGKYIAKKRKEKGLTQKQLADKLLITNKAVSKWENSASLPDISLLKDLANILEVTVDELLAGQDNNEMISNLWSEYTTVKIDRQLKMKYLKLGYYYKKLTLILLISGFLIICCGVAIYSLDRYLTYNLDLMGIIIIILGFLLLIGPGLYLFIKRFFIKDHDIQYLLQEDRLSYIENNHEVSYFYRDIDNIYLIDDWAILCCGKNVLYLKLEDYQLMDRMFINAKIIRPDQKLKIKYWLTGIMIMIALLASGLELGYVLILKRLGFEYFFDEMEMIILVIIAMTVMIIMSINKIISKTRNMVIVSMVSLSALVLIVLGANYLSDDRTYYSIAPGFTNQLVLKQNKQTGQVYDLHHTFLCFGRPNQSFNADGSLQTLWLNSDNNLITYKSNGSTEVYVATYGDRGSGYSYYYVASSLSGKWRNVYDENDVYYLGVENGEITIKQANHSFIFTSEDIKQFGTTAIVLNDNSKPKYVIVLNENCQIESNGLINDGGTITIINVDDLKPVELFCTTYKEDETVQEQLEEQTENSAKKIINQMHEIINDDQQFQQYVSNGQLYKIETTTDDYSELARLVYLEQYINNNDSGVLVDQQMQKITVLAGNENEFYIKINVSGSYTLHGEIEENGIETYYRFLKGASGYLVAHFSVTEDGDYGLASLLEPIVIDVSNDERYHFVY